MNRPDYAEGWNKRATAYYLRGEYSASLRDVRETLRREPRHFGALSGWAAMLPHAWRRPRRAPRCCAAGKICPHWPGLQDQLRDLRDQLDSLES